LRGVEHCRKLLPRFLNLKTTPEIPELINFLDDMPVSGTTTFSPHNYEKSKPFCENKQEFFCIFEIIFEKSSLKKNNFCLMGIFTPIGA